MNERTEPEVGQPELGETADCQATLREIYGYLDGELTVERRAHIAQHLGDCNPCLAAFDFEAEVRMVVAHRCRDEVPEALRQRIAAALHPSPEP